MIMMMMMMMMMMMIMVWISSDDTLEIQFNTLFFLWYTSHLISGRSKMRCVSIDLSWPLAKLVNKKLVKKWALRPLAMCKKGTVCGTEYVDIDSIDKYYMQIGMKIVYVVPSGYD